MLGTSPSCDRTEPQTNGRLSSRWWLAAPVAAALVAFCYVFLAVWFVVHQREFQYTRGGTSGSPEAVGLEGFAKVSISTEDGERIIGWWAPPRNRDGVVLYLHGTRSTLRDTVWRLPDLKNSGPGVMAIGCRGYGDSTGSPSELGFRADARAAFDYICATAPASKVAVFGESPGTGIAVALARERPVAGVLLNAPYASVLRLFELRGPPLPYRWLLSDQFNSEALIGGINVPVMILHGTADDNVPIPEARRLYSAAREPKSMIEVDGAGHLSAWEGGARKPALKALVAWTAPDQQPASILWSLVRDCIGQFSAGRPMRLAAPFNAVSRKFIGPVRDPLSYIDIRRSRVRGIVFEPAILGRVVRRSDDNAVRQMLCARAVADNDGVRP